MGFYVSFPLRATIRAAIYLALTGAASHAMAGGQPLELGTQTGIQDGKSGIVLDTRTGIHDGRSGIVLQSAPLSPEPMVPAQQLPTLEQPGSPSGQPSIVVTPYIELPGTNGALPPAGSGYRTSPRGQW